MTSHDNLGASLFEQPRALAMELTPRQKRLIRLLQDGCKHSVIDIANALHIGDPRSEIRNLRKKGIVVSDEWVQGAGGSNYKRYWIKKGNEYGSI